MKTSQPQQGLL